MAIAKVYTSKDYGDFWFYKNIRSARDLAQMVKFRSLGDNMYTMQFLCLGDWDKVMEGVRGSLVLMAPYDGFTKPSTMDLNKLKMWLQIHDLPNGFGHLVMSLEGQLYAEENHSRDFSGKFYQAKVIVNVRKQLRNHVFIVKDKKRHIFKVKYMKDCLIGVLFVV